MRWIVGRSGASLSDWRFGIGGLFDGEGFGEVPGFVEVAGVAQVDGGSG